MDGVTTPNNLSSEELASIIHQAFGDSNNVDIEEVKRQVQLKQYVEHNPLRQYRKNHGYTQEDIAEACGVSKLTVSNYETGKCSPQMDRLIDYIERMYKYVTANKCTDEVLGEMLTAFALWYRNI